MVAGPEGPGRSGVKEEQGERRGSLREENEGAQGTGPLGDLDLDS